MLGPLLPPAATARACLPAGSDGHGFAGRSGRGCIVNTVPAGQSASPSAAAVSLSRVRTRQRPCTRVNGTTTRPRQLLNHIAYDRCNGAQRASPRTEGIMLIVATVCTGSVLVSRTGRTVSIENGSVAGGECNGVQAVGGVLLVAVITGPLRLVAVC